MSIHPNATPEWSLFSSAHNGVEFIGSTEQKGVISVSARHIQQPSMDNFDANRELRNVNMGDERQDGAMVLEFGHSGTIKGLVGAQGYEAIRTALGYDITETVEYEDADEKVTSIVFSYPTVATLNTFLDHASPGEGLRFATFDGGKYKLTDAAEAFREGLYLVAAEQPYQTHEHGAFHVFGAMGLDAESIDINQRFIEKVTCRMKAEALLPGIPQLREHSQVTTFLSPAHTLARSFGLQLDEVTGTLGYQVVIGDFSERSRNFGPTKDKRLYSGLNQLYTVKSNLFDTIPSFVRDDEPEWQVMERHTQAVRARYDMLEARADALVA